MADVMPNKIIILLFIVDYYLFNNYFFPNSFFKIKYLFLYLTYFS